ncbi:MAG: O-antigen ligase family protein [Octadecabacter sp.]
MLLSAIFSSQDRKRSSFIVAYVLCAVVFFTYFAIRGLLALPDPGLDGALSRISPVLIIALIVWFRPPNVDFVFPLLAVAIVPMAVVLLGLVERTLFVNHLRIELLAGNPLFLTPALIPLGYLNSFLALRAQSVQRQLFHYVGLFAVLFSIGTLAGSRSSFAVILAALVLHLVWTWLFSLNKVRKLRAVHTVVVVLTVLASIWCAMNLGPSASRMSEFASSTGDVFSSSVRLEMWRGALAAIMEEPVFGYGPQNRWAALEGFTRPEISGLKLSHPHNLIMTYGLAGGVFGIVIGLSYVFVPNMLLLVSKRFSASDKELFFVAPAAVFAFGLANYVLFEGYMATVTTLTLLGPYFLYVGQRDARYHW